jgi:hypothetical protein
MVEVGKEAIKVEEGVFGSSEVKALEKRIRECERVLGKKRPWSTRFSEKM